VTSPTIEAIGTRSSPWRGDPLALGGVLSVVGAVSVVITSALYVASPSAAAGPVQPLDLAAAMAGAAQGAATLHAAGVVGVLGDVVWAAAALLVAQALARRGAGLAAAGWNLLLISILLFTLVDAMTGFVFPQLAADGDAGGFEALRRLWALAFQLGTLAFAGGALAATIGDQASPMPLIGRRLAYAVSLVAILGGLGAAAGMAGVAAIPTDKICGASIGLGAALFVAVSWRLARAPQSD
jgi:hypothetical protein